MAIDMWGIGVHESPAANARLWARGTANGTLTAVVNGVSYTGDAIDTAVGDGTGKVNITGLQPNTTYPFVLSIGAASVSSSFKTLPSSDDAVFDFCVFSCGDYNSQAATISKTAVELNPAFIADLGDMIYVNQIATLNIWGENPTQYNTNMTVSKDVTNYNAYWRQSLKHPAAKACHRNVPTIYQCDDHEYGGDDWDHSIENAHYSGDSAKDYPLAAVQTDCDDFWLACNTAAMSYLKGNPSHLDGIAADKPNKAQAGTPASNYPVRFSRFTAGPAEFFLIDMISHRSEVRAVDNASKTMLGASQKQWFKDRLAACTKTYAIVLSEKKTYACNADNTDSWFASGANLGYQTELNEILDYVNAKAGWVNPNLTVIWFSGDSHIANVIYDSSKQHICVNGCPTGAASGPTPSAYTGKNVYIGPTYLKNLGGFRCFAHARITGKTKIEMWIRNGAGKSMWYGYCNAGENILRYPIPQVSI